MKARLVLVEWTDAAALGGTWHSSLHDDPVVENVISVGFFLRSTAHELVLAGAVSEQGAFSKPFGIPKGCINKVTNLKTGVKLHAIDY
jgi:hypothetical protein